MMHRLLRIALERLRTDRRGVTVVEFAIVAPVLCLLLLGFLDIAHTLYVRTMMQGAVQKAGRDSGLESGLASARQVTVDAAVRQQIVALGIRASDITITRRFYRTFSLAAAARAETYTDNNGNGLCDNNEPFDDVNSNGNRDLDGADAGQGGAKDSVLYTVTASYSRLFPIYGFAGIPRTSRLVAQTVFNNQPYGDQAAYGAASVGHCNP